MIDHRIHIINLFKRADRRANVEKQSQEQGFEYKLWLGIEGNLRRCTNISQAFKQIVRYAKEEKFERITIGEDDLFFTAPGAWQHYLINFPDEYDIYLGGVYKATMNGNRIMNGYSGNTLITVHERFFDFFLSANENDHLDRWLGNFAHKFLYLVCQPYVVKQDGSYSDNHMRVPKYDAFYENVKFFGQSH